MLCLMGIILMSSLLFAFMVPCGTVYVVERRADNRPPIQYVGSGHIPPAVMTQQR